MVWLIVKRALLLLLLVANTCFQLDKRPGVESGWQKASIRAT